MKTPLFACLLAVAAAGCEASVSEAREQRGPAQPAPTWEPRAAARSSGEPRTRARDDEPRPRAAHPEPANADPEQLVRVTRDSLCVTRGELAGAENDRVGGDIAGIHVTTPTFRAVAPEMAGDAATLRFTANGRTETTRALASGQDRRQLGLKLRAQDGCNLVYVMWRLDPKPAIDVSIKRNPGQRTAAECGAAGYTKIKAARHAKLKKRLPTLDDGRDHELSAAIAGTQLFAWVDGQLAFQATIPRAAAELVGPAGVRSDNLDFEIVGFSAFRDPASTARCKRDETD